MLDFLPVPAPAPAARDAVLAALRAHPQGLSLGRFADAAAWLASCQDTVPATAPQRTRVVVFAGQHGIAAQPVCAGAPDTPDTPATPDSPDSIAQQLQQLTAGVSPAHLLAGRADHGRGHVGITVVETPASGAIDVADALDDTQLAAALAQGREAADRAIDDGADLLIPADLGAGNTTVSAALMGRLTGTEPVLMVGLGSGIADALWINKTRIIRDAMFRARHLSDPEQILRCIGGADVAALTGFIAQAAARRTPLLIDSPLTAVAAVLANRLAPGTAAWLLAPSVTAETAHQKALEELQLRPWMDMGITTGQGVGSLLALSLLRDAIDLSIEFTSELDTEVDAETGNEFGTEPSTELAGD